MSVLLALDFFITYKPTDNPASSNKFRKNNATLRKLSLASIFKEMCYLISCIILLQTTKYVL